MRISDWSSDVCSSDLDDDLFTARLGNDLGRNDEAFGALRFAAVTGQQDVAQRHGVAGFAVDLFNGDLVSGGDAILLAARAHDCEHGLPSNQKTKSPAHQSPTKAGDFRQEEHTYELQSLMR